MIEPTTKVMITKIRDDLRIYNLAIQHMDKGYDGWDSALLKRLNNTLSEAIEIAEQLTEE